MFLSLWTCVWWSLVLFVPLIRGSVNGVFDVWTFKWGSYGLASEEDFNVVFLKLFLRFSAFIRGILVSCWTLKTAFGNFEEYVARDCSEHWNCVNTWKISVDSSYSALLWIVQSDSTLELTEIIAYLRYFWEALLKIEQRLIFLSVLCCKQCNLI